MRPGDIYHLDLGTEFGREPGGVWPVVVISDDVFSANPLVVIVLIGADATAVPPASGVLVTAAESGAPSDLVLFPYQVRALDPGRFSGPPAGAIPPDKFDRLLAKFQAYIARPEG